MVMCVVYGGTVVAPSLCLGFVYVYISILKVESNGKALHTRAHRYKARRRGGLSYLAPLGSENISAPYFRQCFFRGRG